jgi:hypothetical protein
MVFACVVGMPCGKSLIGHFTVSGGTGLNDRRLRDTASAVSRQIMHHLAAAGGMAHVNGGLQIEMRRQSREVVGIVIHVVAIADLGGAAAAAAVMGNDATALIEEKQHLRVPVIGRQRPAMAEHDRLSIAPILVEISTPSFIAMVRIASSPPSRARGASFTAPIARHFAVDLLREACLACGSP